MSHWLVEQLGEDRKKSALKEAERALIHKELSQEKVDVNVSELEKVILAIELAVLDSIPNGFEEDEDKLNMVRRYASDAFRLLRALPLPKDSKEASHQLLRMSAFAVLADRSADASRELKDDESWPDLPLDSEDWGERTWATIVDVWLRLIRKDGWDDRDAVLERIKDLRDHQNQYEKIYLDGIEARYAKGAALELIGLYHLAKAAEILAQFITDGVVEGNYQVQQILDTHFDRVLAVCGHARMIQLEPMARLLSAVAKQMVKNSIWTVTRAVNSKVTKFVRALVERGRGDKALFDVLPPQRRALAERGLLGSSRRAIVVSLPTSSGKTLVAQFRILQALNQFDSEQGWVAYLAPTRALVNQVTRQLRSDFEPLNVIVEKVSPALEVDSVEMSLLEGIGEDKKFRVLVTTPEKLNLMLRQGWEEKIGRPLTLVVVDEAHNIQSESRGLTLELLLATINNECPNAQFLLLTPFINNAKEVARWLGGDSSDDISLALDWQPNDRVIGIVRPVKGDAFTKTSFDYSMNFETVHTTRDTVAIDESISFPKVEEISKTFNQANEQGKIAAIAAQNLEQRDPVIVMHARPDWVWSLAAHLKIEQNRSPDLTPDVKLVQDYLRFELGDDFPLIELLEYGVGVHHAGLPDEVRELVEWLFANSELKFLVATTTIAQGINFPVSGVIIALHQYPDSRTGLEDMPAEDFWNIAGRAGRITHKQLGVVALASNSDDKDEKLREFIKKQTGDLNSSLIQLAVSASNELSDLGRIVYDRPEWSSFLQYLAHTYRQMGKPDTFIQQIEQVLRGTFGFEKLRIEEGEIARKLLTGIQIYTAEHLQIHGQPLKLVDSTGFSLQSIKTVLKHKGNINENSWNPEALYSLDDRTLQDMMGILLRVPELQPNFDAVMGGNIPDGDTLSLIIKDWVGGISISEIADRYFKKGDEDRKTTMTKCGQHLFGKIVPTVSWGLGALLAITGSKLSEDELKERSNLPSRAFYGVNSDEAIIFRLLGVPRVAAPAIAKHLKRHIDEPIHELRGRLSRLSEDDWTTAIGNKGKTYCKVWRILEGVDA